MLEAEAPGQPHLVLRQLHGGFDGDVLQVAVEVVGAHRAVTRIDALVHGVDAALLGAPAQLRFHGLRLPGGFAPFHEEAERLQQHSVVFALDRRRLVAGIRALRQFAVQDQLRRDLVVSDQADDEVLLRDRRARRGRDRQRGLVVGAAHDHDLGVASSRTASEPQGVARALIDRRHDADPRHAVGLDRPPHLPGQHAEPEVARLSLDTDAQDRLSRQRVGRPGEAAVPHVPGGPAQPRMGADPVQGLAEVAVLFGDDQTQGHVDSVEVECGCATQHPGGRLAGPGAATGVIDAERGRDRARQGDIRLVGRCAVRFGRPGAQVPDDQQSASRPDSKAQPAPPHRRGIRRTHHGDLHSWWHIR